MQEFNDKSQIAINDEAAFTQVNGGLNKVRPGHTTKHCPRLIQTGYLSRYCYCQATYRILISNQRNELYSATLLCAIVAHSCPLLAIPSCEAFELLTNMLRGE
jgi:hypothetical protein